MKKISISLLALILFGVQNINAQTGTIITTRAIVRQKPGKGKKLGAMRFGLPVKILSQKGSYTLVVRNHLKGWVLSRKIVKTPPRFSNVGNTSLLAPRITLSGKNAYLYYYFKNKIFKYSVLERKIESSQNSGPISEILANNDNERLLLEGVYTNHSNIHSLSLFDYNNVRMQLLGSFVKKSVLVANSSFSPNKRYLAVSFKIGSKRAVVLYSAKNGRYIGSALHTDGVLWSDNGPVFYNSMAFWTVNITKLTNENLDYNQNRLLFKTRRLKRKNSHILSRFYKDRLYIQSGRKVKYYDFQEKKLKNSRLKSIDFDDSFTLQHLSFGLVAIKGGQRYSRFGGSKPKYRFDSFVGNHILYRRLQNRLSSYFLAPIDNPYSADAYQYKSIGKINARADNGILAQIVTDGNKSIIWVENPYKARFEMIRLW